MTRELAQQAIFVLPAADPHSVPLWVWWAANFLANLPIPLMLVGAVLIFLPLYRPIWLIETGEWLLASGLILALLLWSAVLLLILWPLAILLLLGLVAYLAWCVWPPHRELEVVTEAVIDARPDRLFPLAIEPASQLRLQPGLQESFVKGGGPLAVGSVIVARAKVKWVRLTGEDMLVEYDPPRRYTERTLNAPPNQLTVTFEPAGEQTRVTCRYFGRSSVARAIMGAGFRRGATARRLRRHREEWLQALRREAGSPD